MDAEEDVGQFLQADADEENVIQTDSQNDLQPDEQNFLTIPGPVMISSETLVQTDLDEGNGIQIDLHNDVQPDGRNFLTIPGRTTLLSEGPLPVNWSWSISPLSDAQIVFIQIDPVLLKIRVYLYLYNDLSVTIRTSDCVGEMKLDHQITTISEFEELINSVEKAQICTGSGVRPESRSRNCTVIVEERYQRFKTPRCVHCREIRRLRLKNVSRNATDVKTRYARSKQKVYEQRRQYQRLLAKTPDGVVKKAHWRALLNFESFVGSSLKIAYKLTPDHLDPKGYQKMNVPMAFQLFSEPVRVAMAIYGKDGRCPALQDSGPTQNFIKRINDLIEAMMSRTPYQAIYIDDRFQRKKAVVDFLEYLQTWERCAKAQKVELPISSSTLIGFKVSLGATLQIVETLHEDCGSQYLMAARLNQDALERFFGMMRASCGANDHPDAVMFSQVFRLLCSYSLVKPPRGSNVSGPELLQTLMQTKESLAAAKQPRQRWLEKIDWLLESGPSEECNLREEINENGHLLLPHSQSTDSHLDDHSYDVHSSSDEVQSYLAGYVVRKMQRTVKCGVCLSSLISENNNHEPREAMIELLSRGGLQFPSETLFHLTKTLENVVLDVVGKKGITLDTLTTILDSVSELREVPRVGCPEHAKDVTKKIIDFYLVMRGHFLSKCFNIRNNNNKEKTRMYRKHAKL